MTKDSRAAFATSVQAFSEGASMKPWSWVGSSLFLLALSNLVLADGFFIVTSQDGAGRNGQVTKYDASSGAFIDVIVGPLENYRFRGATVGPDGLLYFSVFNNLSSADSKILRYDLDGNFVDEFVGAGSQADGKLGNPDGLGVASPLRFGPDGNLYVIANSGIFDEIISFDGETGEYLGPVVNSIVSPTEFVFGADGLLYVSVSAQNPIPSSIQRFDVATGQRVDVFVASRSGGLVVPGSISFGTDGDLYVASFAEKAVFRYDGDSGAFVERFANLNDITDAPCQDCPTGVVLGPDGNMYLDTRHPGPLGGVARFDGTSGEYLDRFVEIGSGGLKLPRGKDMLFVDSGCSRFSDGGLRNRCFTPSTSKVVIDIKPGSDPNCFNVNGHGVIPVAVLGSESLDVMDVDISTLSFGGLAVRMRGKKGAICGYEDSNDDGNQDLVCQFEDDPSAWNVGSDSATLSGELLDGAPFEGSDSICVVP
jgi:hypothetical protein